MADYSPEKAGVSLDFGLAKVAASKVQVAGAEIMAATIHTASRHMPVGAA